MFRTALGHEIGRVRPGDARLAEGIKMPRQCVTAAFLLEKSRKVAKILEIAEQKVFLKSL